MKSDNHAGAHKRTSRRKFTKTVAAALVVAPLASRLGSAQTPSRTKQTPAPPNQQPSLPPANPSPVAEAYADVARARFGEHFTPDQFGQIKKDLDGNLRTADRLRAFKLKNADEPDFIFSAE